MRGRETAKTVVCCVARFPFAGKARLQQWLQIWTVNNTTQWDSVLIDSWLWPNQPQVTDVFSVNKTFCTIWKLCRSNCIPVIACECSICMLAEKEVFLFVCFYTKNVLPWLGICRSQNSDASIPPFQHPTPTPVPVLLYLRRDLRDY